MRAMCAYSRLRKRVFFSALDRRTCSVKCAPTDPNASGEAFFAVGEDVIEQKTMPISDPLRRQRSSGNQAHHCGPAHPKKIGGLLSGEFHRLRSDGHRLARVKRRYHLG